MPLDQQLCQLVEPHLSNSNELSAIGLGICWPSDSALSKDIGLHVERGETIDEAAERHMTGWSPKWLVEAGFTPNDADGQPLVNDARCLRAGPIQWYPEPRLGRFDDQTKDDARGASRERRLAGEVAVTALWAANLPRLQSISVKDIRPVQSLTGNARGARFKNYLVFTLQHSLPDGWRVEPEVPLTSIRGLHMRKDVGSRSSDIAVIDEGSRLVAVVSSKWTWRSDRGTEAAQMVPLKLYRPDVPYALVTAEFPRASTVSRESVEDSAYHLCPTIAGAFRSIYDASQSPRLSWPALDDLRRVGDVWASTAALPSLSELVVHLRKSGTIL